MEDGYYSVYIRNTFEIDDPSLVQTLTLNADYDDAFICYINGTEVIRTGGMYYETSQERRKPRRKEPCWRTNRV